MRFRFYGPFGLLIFCVYIVIWMALFELILAYWAVLLLVGIILLIIESIRTKRLGEWRITAPMFFPWRKEFRRHT